METFFTYLKKVLVTSIFMIFAVAATYTPQDWNKVQYAHAGGAVDMATEHTQVFNNIELIFIDVLNTLIEGWSYVTSWATENLWIKESVLDGIAWTLAKAVISSMVDSLVNWINSGFKGSPMFVQDLSRFLTDVADRVMGEYIQNLGGLGSFLCDPFKLDIQIALALQYQRSRVDQPAPTCTLSGIIDNISGFLDGAQGSFGEGGWNDWFDITAQPETYTPYGATLAAQTGAHVRILNAKGEEAFKLEWGDGFLSGEICQIVSGANGDTEECAITKPGKIIEEALSFNLDSGRQSLVTADEMNEIISALLGQLAQTVFTGAAGLLGLSGGTGFTYSGFSGGSYLAQMQSESSVVSANSGLKILEDARDLEIAYRDLAIAKKIELQAIAASTTASASVVAAANAAIIETDTVIADTTGNLLNLNSQISDYSAATNATDQAKVMEDYSALPLHTQSDINASKSSWNAVITTANQAAASSVDSTLVQMKADLQTQKDYKNLASLYKPQLETYASASTTPAASSSIATAAAGDAQNIIDTTNTLITKLTDIITNYEAASSESLKIIYIADYQKLDLYTQADITNSKTEWDAILP